MALTQNKNKGCSNRKTILVFTSLIPLHICYNQSNLSCIFGYNIFYISYFNDIYLFSYQLMNYIFFPHLFLCAMLIYTAIQCLYFQNIQFPLFPENYLFYLWSQFAGQIFNSTIKYILVVYSKNVKGNYVTYHGYSYTLIISELNSSIINMFILVYFITIKPISNICLSNNCH